MATTSQKLPSQTSKNSVPKDEKKDEEELNMISSLDTLFEEYRIVKELAFDISKQEKTNKLNNIQKKIEILIKSIDERYPYQETLNMEKEKEKDKDNKENKGNNNKNKKKNKINNNNNKERERENKIENVGGMISRAQYLYIIGRYYYILNNFSLSSPLLQESIKLDPLLIECWNTLGDIYYNNSELFAPKFCFESALEYDKYNEISYIPLSKILRKLRKNQMEIIEN